MSDSIKYFRQLIRDARRNETVVWTRECPKPEELLDWIEEAVSSITWTTPSLPALRRETLPIPSRSRGAAAPPGEENQQADRLLDHVLTCAYCRREYADMLEIRALASKPILTPIPPPGPVSLPQKAKDWVGKLKKNFITPLNRNLLALRRQAAVLAAARNAHLATRGLDSATRSAASQITFISVRPQQQILRWSANLNAQEFIVSISSPGQPVWKVSAGSDVQLTLPEQKELMPGHVCEWQVTAHMKDKKYASPIAYLAVLTEQLHNEVATLEQQIGDLPLARISLYEAYGLYAEALQEVEKWLETDENRELAGKIKNKLLERLPVVTPPH